MKTNTLDRGRASDPYRVAFEQPPVSRKRTSMNHNRTLLVCILLAFLSVLAYGQEFRGRVQGLVTDTSQAVISGANVTLENVNTGVSTVRQTNETGHYLFDLVDPGTYSVSVEFTGFTKVVQENVALQ